MLRLPGRLLVQTESGEMAEVGAQSGVVNRQYSIAPLTADFNGDGRSDIVHINIAGNSQAFLSTGDTPNGFLKIQLPENLGSIGAMVEITLEDGSSLFKPYTSGEGLASDSSRMIIAGLGMQTATSVTVDFIDGTSTTQDGSFRNEILTFEDAGQ
jgi:hypothetical protein